LNSPVESRRIAQFNNFGDAPFVAFSLLDA